MRLSIVPTVCLILVLLVVVLGFSYLHVQASVEPETLDLEEEFSPPVSDWRIVALATAGVVIFAVVIIIACCLKKGRSDGFGTHR